jgi:hypothetical protein
MEYINIALGGNRILAIQAMAHPYIDGTIPDFLMRD